MSVNTCAFTRRMTATVFLLSTFLGTSALSNELKPPVPLLLFAANETYSNHDGETSSMAKAGTVKIKHLLIENAWTRQSPPASKVVGGYLSITNNGASSDWLISGSAKFAKRVEVHQMSITNGVMKMSSLPDGLEIKPGETVDLKPGSFHLMFMDATSPKAGETVPVTLVFKSAGPVIVDMPVAPIGAGSAPQHDHHKMKHSE